MDRRDFLTTSTAWLAATWLGRPLRSQSRERVAVVGAGIAGLAAARALAAEGFSVTVLEGRDRLGGRIHTDRSLGVPVDLGASWIHDASARHPIVRLARQLDLRRVRTDWDDLELVDVRGQVIDTAVLARFYDDFEALVASVLRRGRRSRQDRSVRQALEAALLEEYDSGRPPPGERQLFDWLCATLELDAAAPLERLSLRHADAGEGGDGADLLLPDGYSQLVEHLAGGLDVRLGHLVRRIEHRPNRVVLHTDGGTVEADRAVVTLPLGVLKESLGGDGVRFTPALPEWKRSAIGRLGVGDLEKVAARFGLRFWTGSEFLGDLAGVEEGFPVVLNLARHHPAHVLVGLRTGAAARRHLEAGDEALAAELTAALERRYGVRAAALEAVIASRWRADPLARGAYSHIPVGGDPADYDALAEPVGERLFFAGEATHRGHPATVHGAYLSGVREARRLIQLG